ncbi:hypothetical protein MHBO_002522 [Bonamia ostreae]|uniref:Importin-7/11-like TPR repeats domain-containing protein n=1 Tax=Bonamia ostreae TaxID=126728 RepID=A0ABV2AML1_9EUKA
MRKSVNRENVTENQKRIFAFFQSDKMANFLKFVIAKFVPLSHFEIEVFAKIQNFQFFKQQKEWNENSEEFAINYFLTPYVNVHSLALKMMADYANIFPFHIAKFLMSILTKALNSQKSEKSSEIFAVVTVFAVCFTFTRTELSKINFDLVDFLEILLKMAENREENEPLLKLAFCRSFDVLLNSTLFRNESQFAQDKMNVLDRVLKMHIEMLNFNNLTIKLLCDSNLRKMASLNCFRKKIEPTMISGLFAWYAKILNELDETSSKLHVLQSINEMISLFKEQIKVCYARLLNDLAVVFDSKLQEESMLKLEFLDILCTLLETFPFEVERLNDFLIKIILVCTNDKEYSLTERGFELLRIYLFYASSCSGEIEEIFKKALKYFLSKNRAFKTNYDIVQSFLLFKGRSCLSQFLVPIEKVMWSHLDTTKRSELSPLLNSVALIIRILKKESICVDKQLLEKIFVRTCANPIFSSAADFGVSFRALSVFQFFINFLNRFATLKSAELQ